MTQLRDSFSITPVDAEKAMMTLGSMIKDISDRFPGMKKPEPAPSQPTSTGPAQLVARPVQAVQVVQPATAANAPLNAANLQQHLQQQQNQSKMNQRPSSRNSQTPAAPTSSQPPFQFGASSPQGLPAYINKASVTQENLHIPARKKQKPNNTPTAGQATPGSNASPKLTKTSPETKMLKQPSNESKAPAKPSLTCSEPGCDRHDHGFDSEDALRLHTQEEHIRPLENPLKFAQESLAASLGLDAQGQPKKLEADPATEGASFTGLAMAPSGSRQGQTPPVGAASASMTRQVSMNRQPSAASARSNAQSKNGKETPLKPQAGQKDSTKQGLKEPVQQPTPANPWSSALVDPHDLFQGFQISESGAGGAVLDTNAYRSITPHDTPESSKDGLSEPNSDISEGVALDISLDIFDDSWQPFGPPDTDGLFGLSNNDFGITYDDDFTMFEEDKPSMNFRWDDIGDSKDFDKPFVFDSSMFSMNAE